MIEKNGKGLCMKYPIDYNFIVCHKPFENKFNDYCNVEIITDQNVDGATQIDNEGMDSRVYGELPFWKYILNNITDNDTATLHHYRRKLKLGISQIILPIPIRFNCSCFEQMSFYLSPKLADSLKAVLTDKEKEVLNGDLFFAYNIFKAPKCVIKDWVDFTEAKVLKAMDKLGCGFTLEECREFVKNDKSFTGPVEGKDTRIDYQARIGAMLCERVNTVFWLTRDYNRTYASVNLLEVGQKI
jgi:hypothetical protein